MNPLQTFYGNKPERETFKAFQLECLRELAADKAIEGLSTAGIKEAQEAIDRAYERLEELYGKEEPMIIPNPR